MLIGNKSKKYGLNVRPQSAKVKVSKPIISAFQDDEEEDVRADMVASFNSSISSRHVIKK